jgi:DNA-binding LacI/PurR family transcriptional regulator
MGEIAAATLLRAIAGEDVTGTVLPTRLVVRGSSGRPSANDARGRNK